MKFDKILKEDLYRYDGYLYREGKKTEHVKWYTSAVSRDAAFRNFLFKARKAGSDDLAEVEIELIRNDHKEVNAPAEANIKYCDMCGTRLTDGGFCPKCDDLPDYMEEKLILENDKKCIDKSKKDCYNIDMMKKEIKRKPTPISESTGVKHKDMKSLANEVKKFYPKSLEVLGK